MKPKKIKDPWIAKERFDYVLNVKEKLSYKKWIEFIDVNRNYFTWFEDTESGKYLKNNINDVPEGFRKAEINRLDKMQVLAEFNEKMKYYEIVISFNKGIGVVSTTFMKRITKKHLQMLLEMANYLDGYLLNNGNKIIDQDIIESY